MIIYLEYQNGSHLLCRATTGSGFSKRRLYTNDQDVVYSIMRAIGFNGINLAATKADLLDRGIIIQTDTIPRGNRRRIKAIWDKFYAIRPQLLAYILDTLVKVIAWKKENPGVELINDLPRMAAGRRGVWVRIKTPSLMLTMTHKPTD